MVKNLSEDIKNKIIKLKNEKNKISKIIDIIFNEDNIKLSKYSISKITKEIKDLSNSEKSNESNKSEKSHETETEEEKNESVKNDIVNNSLIDKLNNSNNEEWSEEDEENLNNKKTNNIIPPKKLITVEYNEEPKKQINKTDLIHDVINNTNNLINDDVNELREKRSLIIIIRQYLKVFKKELQDLNINEKLLFNHNINKLKVILENIRIELNLKKNSNLFLETSKNILIGYEKVMCHSGIDLNGVWDDLLNNPDFIYDLQMISCEVDISKYINPKWSAFLKVVQSSYLKYEQNKIINNLEKKLNNEDVLNKLKNISK